MLPISIKPSDKLIKGYYEALGQFESLHASHEGAVRKAFQDMLSGYSRKLEWTLVPEYPIHPRKGQRIIVDGAVIDFWKQRRGFWEAKDEHDDLEREIKAKIEKGYPTKNIIFQAPERAILYQNNVRQGLNEDIREPKNLVDLLTEFYGYREPDHEEWEAAVKEFGARIPELADAARKLIEKERKSTKAFRESFEAFYDLCRQAINPKLSDKAVEEMLIQHLLTERIFRRVFHNEEFRSRNVIACEIEKVITSMTSRHFSRDQFLSELDRFYKAIERSADDKEDYTEKQAFLNTVYERFFQGYSPKEADTHGIVYTPQPIVDFMVRSVEDILKKEFGKSLADRGVHILDPFVGTGNFITRVMRQIAETKKSALPYKYEHELHCNEVMLLPYYIASMNIEHEYVEEIGEYRPFEGICLVDTFELAEPEQRGFSFMTEENTQRVKRQRESPIFVVLGNPPYNAGQDKENDNNKNRKYPALDKRISDTYARSSHASTVNKTRDPFIRAFRWASDRIGSEGVIALITNSSYIEQHSSGGIRKHLSAEFDSIFLLDLGGNVRKNPAISGTSHNVFGIQLGVVIAFLVRTRSQEPRRAKIMYAAVDDFLKREARLDFLDSSETVSGVGWEEMSLSDDGSWSRGIINPEYQQFIEIANKATKAGREESTIFRIYSLGANTNRDAWVYDFSLENLRAKVASIVETYNTEVHRWEAAGKPKNIDAFVVADPKKIAWSSRLKECLQRHQLAEFGERYIRKALYRPFCTESLHFDEVLIHRRGRLPEFFPTIRDNDENRVLCATGVGAERPFASTATKLIPDLNFYGPGTVPQWFSFYTYSEDGSNRRENITDWALNQFRTHYNDPKITKWDIFHYVYALLHHPQYRERYAANLKRELPRIPFAGADGISGLKITGAPSSSPAFGERVGSDDADFTTTSQASNNDHPATGRAPRAERHLAQGGSPGLRARTKSVSALPKAGAEAKPERQNELGAPSLPSFGKGGMRDADKTNEPSGDEKVFWAFAEAGRRLADLHVNYESQPEYPLQEIENPNEKPTYRVEKMRLGKDKTSLMVNSFLTLSGIPPETYNYKLGNRSALEWVIDQYQVSTDKRSGITNDPNREDDPEYIVRLVKQVVHVSLETVKIVNALPALVEVEPTTEKVKGKAQ